MIFWTSFKIPAVRSFRAAGRFLSQSVNSFKSASEDSMSYSCTPCVACVDTSDRGIVQKWGKFSHIALPGLNCICWPVQTLDPVSVKVVQVDCVTLTKTKDNVTVSLTTAVQYAVDATRVQDYYFKLGEPRRQIEAHVDNVMRSQIPRMDLDAAFASKDEVASAVKQELSQHLGPFGLVFYDCLLTEMQPDLSVLTAMNEINAARRAREANIERAEAEKVLAVKRAEAEAEAKHLSGIGIARMRQAITDGFKTSILSMQESCGLDAGDVVHMMLTTQYLDTLRDHATNGKSSIVIPHGPGAVSEFQAQVVPM